MDTIRGIVTKVLKRDEATGNLFADVRYEAASGPLEAKLGGFSKELSIGDYFLAQGDWKETQSSGRFKPQPLFRAKTLRPDLPSTKEGAVRWIEGMFDEARHGVTPQTVKAFVDRHGDKVAHACEQTPELIAGVSKNPEMFKAAILKEWGRRVSGRQAVRLMEKAGVDRRAVSSILDTYRDRALEIIRTNPYQASRVKHVGFGNVDKIGREIKIDAKDDRRVAAALVEVLSSYRSEGSTWARLGEVGDRMDAAFQIDTKTATAYVIAHMRSPSAPFVVEQRNGAIAAMLRELRDGELAIAKRACEMLAQNRSGDRERVEKVAKALFAQEKYAKFDEVQRAAVMTALNEAFSILTGGPGTGKSTVSEVIVMGAKRLGVTRVLLCAPTGKAAKRLEETTGEKAMTVHRLLEAKMDAETGGTSFKRNAKNPLPSGCLVLCDESSMLDVTTARALFEAMPSDGKLILVGDRNQLPSVDAGAVLGDLLTAKGPDGAPAVPSTELINVYRQSRDSEIATGAAKVRQGELPFLSKKPLNGLVLYEHDSSDIVKRVRWVVQDICQKVLRLRPHQIAVLSPQAKGTAGTWEINRVMSEVMNPGGKPIPGAFLTSDDDPSMPVPKVGDRVMLTENDDENDVMNGDVGTILESMEKATPNGGKRNFIKVHFDCGKDVEYPTSKWRTLILAYAMTIHKSQGSQYHAVIMPVTMAHVNMLDRSLLYTGWTRAKNMLFLVGEREALEKSVSTTDASARNTRLAEYLEKGALEAGLRRTPEPRTSSSIGLAPKPAAPATVQPSAPPRRSVRAMPIRVPTPPSDEDGTPAPSFR